MPHAPLVSSHVKLVSYDLARGRPGARRNACSRKQFSCLNWPWRHGGDNGNDPKAKVEVLFMDTHVETVPYLEFISGKDRAWGAPINLAG